MKKAIVTGANGFIGSWLCNKLADEGVNVFAIVKNTDSNIERIDNNDNIRIIYCELSEIDTLKYKITDKDIDVFYHLAWTGSGGQERANYELQLLNIKYACDCAQVAKNIGCKKFLSAGTITEKIAEDILNIDVKSENMIYGLAKHTTHLMLDIVCRNLDLEYVWMQFSNIYGPYNTSGNIVSYTLNELKQGNIPSFSKAEQPYDLMYIKDLVNAIYLLGIKKTSKSCYFLGSGESKQLREYLLKIKEVYSNGCKIGLGLRPEDGLIYNKEWFEIQDLINDVEYKSYFTFEKGISETIEWIKQGD